MDELFLENLASWNCDLYTVGGAINEVYVSFGFPAETPDEDVGTISGGTP